MSVPIPVSAVSWPNPTQYAQAIIDDEPLGTHFVLATGTHRMQSVQLRLGDTFEFVAGTIMSGSQDISGLTWTQSGSTWWASISDITMMPSVFDPVPGYVRWRQWPIIDGDPKPFRALLSQVDATSCYYDAGANRLYIGVNPATASSVELARKTEVLTADLSTSRNVTVKGDRTQPGIIENYASGESTSGAGLNLGRYNHVSISNSGWVLQDIEIRNFRGMALSHAEDSLVQRIKIHHTGQLGCGGSNSHDLIFRYNALYVNGIGGWTAGAEAGNVKWTHQSRGQVYGNYFDTAAPNVPAVEHPHQAGAGIVWFDIDNDGVNFFRNLLLDRGTNSIRGLFWEISWSAKIYYNTLWFVGLEAAAPDQMLAMSISASGAVPGSTHYDSLEVFDNHMYQCAGGPKGAQEERASGPIGDFGYYNCDYHDVHDNIIQYMDAHPTGWTEQAGITGVSVRAWGYQFDWDKNLYAMSDPESGHWRITSDMEFQGGGTGTVGWTAWKAFGFGANSVMVDPDGSHPRKDFDPFRGGAL